MRTVWLAAVLALATSAHAVPTYNFIDLGTLGGDSSWAFGVNDRGQVTGGSATSDDIERAFIWDAVYGMTDLGALTPAGNSIGLDINNRGQVAGQSNGVFAVLWDPVDGIMDLGTLGGGRDDIASGINDRGQVTGETRIPSGEFRAFLWDEASGMIDLGALLPDGGSSAGRDISNRGQVTGSSQVAAGGGHAFIWDAVNGIVDLGTLGGQSSSAASINDRGQVVGGSRIAGDTESHAFIWDTRHRMVALGTLGGQSSSAASINNRGWVVGSSNVVDSVGFFDRHAFIWDAAFGMLDLNDLVLGLNDWGVLTEATAISDTGYIAGYGVTNDGARRAVLLTSIPEPRTLVLLGIGFAAMGLARHRRANNRRNGLSLAHPNNSDRSADEPHTKSNKASAASSSENGSRGTLASL